MESPLPPGWQMFRNQDGYPYYWHAETNTTQWEYPAFQAQYLPQEQPIVNQPVNMAQPNAPLMQPLYPQPQFKTLDNDDDQFKVEGVYDFSKEEGIIISHRY
jgi:hypothetical protein